MDSRSRRGWSYDPFAARAVTVALRAGSRLAACSRDRGEGMDEEVIAERLRWREKKRLQRARWAAGVPVRVAKAKGLAVRVARTWAGAQVVRGAVLPDALPVRGWLGPVLLTTSAGGGTMT